MPPQLQIRGIQPDQHLSGLHTLSNFGRARDELARHAKPDTRLGSGPHFRCKLAASRAGLGLHHHRPNGPNRLRQGLRPRTGAYGDDQSNEEQWLDGVFHLGWLG
jgi:hypothetical protein